MPTPSPRSGDDSERSRSPGADASFSARLRSTYGEDVADSPRATSDLVRRLSQHSLKTSRYKLEGEVARGGMGAILRVWDADLRRRLAMKVILGRDEAARRAEGGSAASRPRVEPGVLARFLEEAQVTGQLDHPGIVPVHELGIGPNDAGSATGPRPDGLRASTPRRRSASR